MNGIKFIREKSNFSRNALAERMGVTRQTVTLWERGVRKPDKSHLKWLCDFYGVEEKWFGELSDDDITILKVMKMYRHYDGEKEYFSFIPEKDGWAEISIPCGELDDLLDERYANVLKKKKISYSILKTILSVNTTANTTTRFVCLIRFVLQNVG